VLGLAAAVGAIAAVPLAGEVAARRIRLGGEAARKLVHAGSGVVAAALPLLLSYHEIVGVALGFAALMLVVHRLRLLAALTGVERSSLGEVWFPLGIAGLAALAPEYAAYVYGALVLAFADALAAVVGARLGGPRLPFARGKTVAGSLAFCATAVVVGAAVAGGLSPATFAAAVVLTLAEAAASGGSDNAVVPILGGVLATQAWA
jgi:dolichol kinase